MMLSLSDFVSIDTNHIWLQVETAEQEKIWQLSQHHSNAIAIYNAYLNRICLSTLLPWFSESLQESTLRAEVFPSEENLFSILELVNGTAIKVGETKIVLVPTETIDIEELCVPQEWVDINSWAADYYIPVQVNLDGDNDDSWIRVCGFATHRQLKNQGKYNSSDRTYSLPIEQLTENFTLLFATLGLRWREEVPSEVTLSAADQNLLQTLSDTFIYSPRLLDIPFAQWAALISNEQWRQQIYNQRLGKEKTVSTAEKDLSPSIETSFIQVNLNQWFEKLFTAGWQPIDEVLNSQLGNLVYEFRSLSATRKTGVSGVKLIDLGIELGGQSLALMLALSQEEDEKIAVIVQVHPTGNQKYLPPNLKIMLLESGDVLQQIQSRSRDCYIQLNRFKGLSGTSFSIQLILDNFRMIENFSI
ncbi:hypothetical protein A6770_36615 [Nostoc minutum NIES-26]|uniref:DUF1822 domain-containing protein n=1 Tax=Nostoc minutum NIES-26 TaxID=1844469 RepID=A0A367RWN4_9NOSO|nr:hypothetical protein A6770_36615 [Nostoc minutum NIES-26]